MLPGIDQLTATTVPLGQDQSAWVDDGDLAPVPFTVGTSLTTGSQVSAAALRRISGALVRKLNESGYYGVLVAPDAAQIDGQSGEDLRDAGDHSLRLIVWVSEISQVRTLAKGSRFAGENTINNPAHARIFNNSPLKPAEGEQSGSLLRRAVLDDYLRRLNRQPGRNVEAALSSTDEPGRVVLDYLITETKPWFVYAQVSNTGTEATSLLRERVGIVHNQLFKRDDIASLDFITSNFKEANAVFGSYSYPIIFPEKLRLRAHGSWGDYAASVPFPVTSGGAAIPDETFSGDSWGGGAELIWNPIRFWGFDLDLSAGFGYQSINVANDTLGTEAAAKLLTPFASISIENQSSIRGLSASVAFETNTGSNDDAELERMGRLRVSNDYDLIKADISGFIYLEPLFFGVSADNSWSKSTLAHEIGFKFRGQYALGDRRLIPQKEVAVGGFFSVRGYAESAVAGDNGFAGSLEYRFHVPRALRPSNVPAGEVDSPRTEEPTGMLWGRPFNARPPRVYGRPDWDFIIRGFLDYGRTMINDKTSSLDREYTLMSAGAGAELQMWRNLNLRADVGFPLKEIDTGVGPPRTDPNYLRGLNDSESARVHFLLTFVW